MAMVCGVQEFVSQDGSPSKEDATARKMPIDRVWCMTVFVRLTSLLSVQQVVSFPPLRNSNSFVGKEMWHHSVFERDRAYGI
jgi:hypothetical protein